MKAIALYLLFAGIVVLNGAVNKCDICEALNFVLHWGASWMGSPEKRMEWRCGVYETKEEKNTCKEVAKELFERKNIIEAAESNNSIRIWWNNKGVCRVYCGYAL